MASKYTKNIIIEVKNGDALPNNRIDGKSNTGTYFLGSYKFFQTVKSLFDNCISFQFDKTKIIEYKTLFQQYMYKQKDKYPDKLIFFERHSDKLVEICENYTVDVTIRNNDTRFFFRFTNNDDEVVNEFRSILFGEISSIVLSFDNNKCFIYPIISNYDYFNYVITVEDCE